LCLLAQGAALAAIPQSVSGFDISTMKVKVIGRSLTSSATTNQSAQVTNGQQSSAMADTSTVQVTSVSQLSDVQPSDWVYQALQSLIERYGVVTGYPNNTYRGDRAMTRYEFAAGLNAALERVNELIAAGVADKVLRDDLPTLQRLQVELAEELAILQGRIDTLEARNAELESNQFSTTTKLTGQALFAVNAGGFSGDRLVSPTGAEIANDKPNATVLYRASLDFNTSFFGNDLLKIRTDTGSNGINDNAAGVLEPSFGSVLDYSAKPPTNGEFALSRLYYWDFVEKFWRIDLKFCHQASFTSVSTGAT
jgi:porin